MTDSNINNQERMLADRIVTSVEAMMNKFAQDEYGDPFLLKRYYEVTWYILPKPSLFSKPTGTYFGVTLQKDHNKQFGFDYVIFVTFNHRLDGTYPSEKKMVAFCKELSDRTNLPLRGEAAGMIYEKIYKDGKAEEWYSKYEADFNKEIFKD